MDGVLDRASAAKNCLPSLHWNSKLNSINFRIHQLKWSCTCYCDTKYFRQLILKCNAGNHFCTTKTMAFNSLSLANMILLCLGVWLTKAIGWTSYINTSPTTTLDASISMIKGFLKVGTSQHWGACHRCL